MKLIFGQNAQMQSVQTNARKCPSYMRLKIMCSTMDMPITQGIREAMYLWIKDNEHRGPESEDDGLYARMKTIVKAIDLQKRPVERYFMRDALEEGFKLWFTKYTMA